MISDDSRRLQATVSKETFDELEQYAENQGMTKSELIKFLWLYFKTARKEVFINGKD